MKKRYVRNEEHRGILYAMMIFLFFLAGMSLILGGLYLFHVHEDFYTAFRKGLGGGFYLSAWLVLVFSSVLYTPFSYGISYYFIKGGGGLSSFFFLFRRPALLTKAVALSFLKKALIYGERLVLLLGAATVEVFLFFAFLLVTGENVFSVREDPFRLAAEFMLRSPWLIGLSILLWSLFIVGILLIDLRYILCKYVLLLYPDAGVLQSLKVGRLAIKDHLFRTVFFYLRYGAYCLLILVSFGWMARRARHKRFSSYACQLTEAGWRTYCNRRSLR